MDKDALVLHNCFRTHICDNYFHGKLQLKIKVHALQNFRISRKKYNFETR